MSAKLEVTICNVVNLFLLSRGLIITFCFSGKILHIDFGDCFEASMNREKFPEKVSRPCSGLYSLPIT